MAPEFSEESFVPAVAELLPQIAQRPALELDVDAARAPEFAESLSVQGAGSVGVTGAEGAIDRLTHEILATLEQRPTLVVWLFDQSGSGTSDKINALKAVYIPEENKNFTAYLAGSVKIDTRDRLKVQTEQLTYRKATDNALAEEAVAFQRDNLSGTSFGAEVKVAEKKVELHRDVNISQFENEEHTGEAAAKLAAGKTYLARPVRSPGIMSCTISTPTFFRACSCSGEIHGPRLGG